MRPMPLHQRFTPAPPALAAVMAIALAAGHAPLAHAQSGASAAAATAIAINIPAQPLGQALNELARQANLQMTFPAALVAGKQAPAVSGQLTARQALDRLLAGSGLAAAAQGANVVVQPSRPPSTVSEATLPAVTVTAAKEVTVTGERVKEEGYRVHEATTATKSDTPIMETPVAIQVVPREVIEDQQVLRPREALKNVSGVYSVGGSGNTRDDFISRGFDAVMYRDGFRQNYRLMTDPANLERTEVLKGPAAVLYGLVTPGGLINEVTKQPLAAPYYALQQSVGSFNLYRTTVDATGPLTQDKSLLYRFNAAYENAESFRDFSDRERIFVAPVLSWTISEATRLTLDLEYLDSSLPYDRGLIALDPTGRLADIPFSRRLDDPISRQDQEYLTAGFSWSHDFNPDWTLRQHFKAQFASEDSVQVNPVALLDDKRTLTRGVWLDKNTTDVYYTALELTGRIQTGGLRHTLLFGADWYDYEFDAQVAWTEDFPSIDIHNPVYGAARPDVAREPQRYTQTWYGVYLQDQISLRKDVHLLAGLRYDRAHTTDYFYGAPEGIKDREFSPRVGVVYQPRPWLSLYGNYATSFSPQVYSTTRSGGAFEPETATQYEAGLKTAFFDGRLAGTLAVYELTKQNLSATDPTDPNFSLPVGEARSKGVEIDINGQITEAVSLIATYAYTDVKITEDGAGDREGRKLGAPKHGGSLWTRYQFLQGNLEGLRLGAGVFVVGERQGSSWGAMDNTFVTAGYTRTDLMAAYAWKAGSTLLTAQVNINNLFDEQYILAPIDDLRLTPGDPRTVIASIRAEF